MKQSFITQTRWLVTIILLISFAIPRMWGTEYSITMDQNASGNNNVHITETTSPASKTYNGVTWSIAWAGGGSPTSGSKSQVQFGTAKNPCTSVTISTSGISGTITSVSVNTWGASSNDATVSVSVGGTAFKNGNNTSISIGTSSGNKTFSHTGATGTIIISISQTTSKAIYVSGVSVTYSTGTSVSLTKGAETNGSISLTPLNPHKTFCISTI